MSFVIVWVIFAILEVINYGWGSLALFVSASIVAYFTTIRFMIYLAKNDPGRFDELVYKIKRAAKL